MALLPSSLDPPDVQGHPLSIEMKWWVAEDLEQTCQALVPKGLGGVGTAVVGLFV